MTNCLRFLGNEQLIPCSRGWVSVWFNAWVRHETLRAFGAFLGKCSAMEMPFPWDQMDFGGSRQSPMFRCGFGTTSQGLSLHMAVLTLRVFYPPGMPCVRWREPLQARLIPIPWKPELVAFLCESHGGINLAPPRVRWKGREMVGMTLVRKDPWCVGV